MHIIGRYVLLFVIYSFLGALAETLFRLVTEHHLYGINGFLYLPMFPIYGAGAILIILFLKPLTRNPALLFVVSALVATILEFIAHWLIELLFGVRIWDYSHKPFNLEGRVSLDTSLGFGMAAVLLVFFIHPFFDSLLRRLSKRVTIVAALLAIVVLVSDIITSSLRLLG